MMMEQMDGELTMDELVVVSESLEPYVLTYQPSGPHDGAVEVTALVVLKRVEKMDFFWRSLWEHFRRRCF